jgi:signal transduction histidine kinase
MTRVAVTTGRRWSTASWVTFIYAVAGAAIALMAFLTYRSMVQLVTTSHDVEHTYQVLAAIERGYAGLVAATAAVREHVATGDSDTLGGRDEALSRMHTAVQDLRELTRDNPAQQLTLDELQPLIEARLARLNETLLLHQTGDSAAARAHLVHPEPQAMMATIRDRLDDMQLREEALLRQRLAAAENLRVRTSVVSGLLLVAVAAVVIGGLLALLRDGRLKDRLRSELAQRERVLEQVNGELERQAAALKSANKELEGFSYSISHDLRSPLRAIDGFALMLQEDYSSALDAEGRRYISVIRDGAHRMSMLIDDLLKFSRFGRQPLRHEEIDTTALVRRALQEVLAGNTGNTPKFEILDLPKCRGDSALLLQVWVNLLANAVKYSSRASAPCVSAGGELRGEELVFFVRDNGAGFDMKYVNKLFGVFQRLHAAEDYPGTGVGLAIVQRIVTRHGGRAWGEGAIGQGATFYFALPAGGVGGVDTTLEETEALAA